MKRKADDMFKLLTTLSCAGLLSITVHAQGPLLWELQEDLHGGVDMARAVALSGKVAVIVGNGGEPLPGTDESDFVIQALGKRTGAIVWSDERALGPDVDWIFETTRQHRVFALGTLVESDSRSAFLIRAYDVPSGTLLWENIWHPSQGVDIDHPEAIVASPTQVAVVGYGENATGTGLAMLVRAFDPQTGSSLWEDRLSRDSADVIGWSIAANANRVFVAGTTTIAGQPSDLFLRAYDAASGHLVWETTRKNVQSTKLSLTAGRLIVAGSTAGPLSYLAAFSAKSGSLLWEDAAPSTGVFLDVAVNGQRVVGVTTIGNGFAVRAYNLITGDLEWQDRPTVAPGFHQQMITVGLNEDRVFAAGSVGEDFLNSELEVRAYAAQTGALLWDDRSHSSTQTSAFDLTLGKARVFVAGYTSGGATDLDFLVRAYDATEHPRPR